MTRVAGRHVTLSSRVARAGSRAGVVIAGFAFYSVLDAVTRKMFARDVTIWPYVMLVGVLGGGTFVLAFLFPPKREELISKKARPFVWTCLALLAAATIVFALI